MSSDIFTDHLRFDSDEKLDSVTIDVLDDQIEAHKAKDNQRSILGTAIGALYRSDENSLSELESLKLEAERIRKSGDEKALQDVRKRMAKAVMTDRSAVEWQNEISHYGAGFLKTASLFARGKTGWIGAAATFGLDEINPRQSWGEIAADGSLGVLKGTAIKGSFQIMGAKSFQTAPIAVKGVFLGSTARLAEMGLSRHSYQFGKGEDKHYDIGRGMSNVFGATFNRNALLTDVLIFGAAHGTLGQINKASGGRVANSEFLSTTLTGTTFGLTSGALGEIQRQHAHGERFDAWKVAKRSAMQGLVDTGAAAFGYKVSDPNFHRNVQDRWQNGRRALGEKAEEIKLTLANSIALQPHAEVAGFPGLRLPLPVEHVRPTNTRPADNVLMMSAESGDGNRSGVGPDGLLGNKGGERRMDGRVEKPAEKPAEKAAETGETPVPAEFQRPLPPVRESAAKQVEITEDGTRIVKFEYSDKGNTATLVSKDGYRIHLKAGAVERVEAPDGRVVTISGEKAETRSWDGKQVQSRKGVDADILLRVDEIHTEAGLSKLSEKLAEKQTEAPGDAKPEAKPQESVKIKFRTTEEAQAFKTGAEKIQKAAQPGAEVGDIAAAVDYMKQHPEIATQFRQFGDLAVNPKVREIVESVYGQPLGPMDWPHQSELRLYNERVVVQVPAELRGAWDRAMVLMEGLNANNGTATGRAEYWNARYELIKHLNENPGLANAMRQYVQQCNNVRFVRVLDEVLGTNALADLYPGFKTGDVKATPEVADPVELTPSEFAKGLNSDDPAVRARTARILAEKEMLGDLTPAERETWRQVISESILAPRHLDLYGDQLRHLSDPAFAEWAKLAVDNVNLAGTVLTRPDVQAIGVRTLADFLSKAPDPAKVALPDWASQQVEVNAKIEADREAQAAERAAADGKPFRPRSPRAIRDGITDRLKMLEESLDVFAGEPELGAKLVEVGAKDRTALDGILHQIKTQDPSQAPKFKQSKVEQANALAEGRRLLLRETAPGAADGTPIKVLFESLRVGNENGAFAAVRQMRPRYEARPVEKIEADIRAEKDAAGKEINEAEIRQQAEDMHEAQKLLARQHSQSVQRLLHDLASGRVPRQNIHEHYFGEVTLEAALKTVAERRSAAEAAAKPERQAEETTAKPEEGGEQKNGEGTESRPEATAEVETGPTVEHIRAMASKIGKEVTASEVAAEGLAAESPAVREATARALSRHVKDLTPAEKDSWCKTALESGRIELLEAMGDNLRHLSDAQFQAWKTQAAAELNLGDILNHAELAHLKPEVLRGFLGRMRTAQEAAEVPDWIRQHVEASQGEQKPRHISDSMQDRLLMLERLVREFDGPVQDTLIRLGAQDKHALDSVLHQLSLRSSDKPYLRGVGEKYARLLELVSPHAESAEPVVYLFRFLRERNGNAAFAAAKQLIPRVEQKTAETLEAEIIAEEIAGSGNGSYEPQIVADRLEAALQAQGQPPAVPREVQDLIHYLARPSEGGKGGNQRGPRGGRGNK